MSAGPSPLGLFRQHLWPTAVDAGGSIAASLPPHPPETAPYLIGGHHPRLTVRSARVCGRRRCRRRHPQPAAKSARVYRCHCRLRRRCHLRNRLPDHGLQPAANNASSCCTHHHCYRSPSPPARALRPPHQTTGRTPPPLARNTCRGSHAPLLPSPACNRCGVGLLVRSI